MKKLLLFILSLFVCLSLAACNHTQTNKPSDDGDDTDLPDPKPSPSPSDDPETTDSIGFIIHFNLKTKTSSGDYKYNLWLWAKDAEGKDYQFNGEDDFGVYAKYKFEEVNSTAFSAGLGFIVKENKPWADSPSKDYDQDRFLDFSTLDKDKYGYYHAYLMTGDANIYSNDKLEVNDAIMHFSMSYNETTDIINIWFQTNHEFSEFSIKADETIIVSNETVDTDSNVISKSKKRIQYKLSEFPDLKKEYTLKVKFAETGNVLTKAVNKASLYNTKKFNEIYAYDGALGAIYEAEKTTFKVWSPFSTEIKLRIYDNGTPTSVSATKGSDLYQEYLMLEGEKGVWSKELVGDLEGKYYTYIVTNSKYTTAEIVDPYAKSAGVNGLRGMIVDFSKTNPDGWDELDIHNYESRQLTVYETHIADLTSSASWGGTAENAKKYAGFYESGTTYTEGSTTVKTGFDHIKELGVNAVQILPIFDQANNEVNVEFNWGYNPLNYNVIEGAYSSNPYDGYERIKEFKNLVKAYNEAGINIIMDVVYNHVNGLEDSNFDVLMPNYYFRYNSGVASNGSGCGNETASEMYMFRKFMKDSTEFLAKEYKLGGFRFDLMGIHDVETMNQLAENLHENVNEFITVYGEPWAGGTIGLFDADPANQSNMNKFEGYGCFNDKIRDALIKGGLSGAAEKGWITDNTSVNIMDVQNISNGLIGNVLGLSNYDPNKCVNYVTCHDNYTLYDRIKAAGITDEATIKKMAMLANSVVFTSQGITFMLSGEEFLRTKQGNSNSYNASYEVNMLDYSLKIKNLDMFKSYQKLIALKQNKAVFAQSKENLASILVQYNADASLIYFDLTDSVNQKTYRIVLSNGVSGEKEVDLEGYTLYLDTLNKTNLDLTSKTVIEDYQTIIAYKNVE